jgi:hypothetical protein
MMGGYDNKFIWAGVTLDNVSVEEEKHIFERFILNMLNIRVKLLEIITTIPGYMESGHMVHEGNRTDILFSVHNDDMKSFEEYLGVLNMIPDNLVVEWDKAVSYFGKYAYEDKVLQRHPYQEVPAEWPSHDDLINMFLSTQLGNHPAIILN